MQFITSARLAELNAQSKMRGLGFLDAIATPVGADGGIDVTSHYAVAQVKWKGAQAGRPELQQLHGASLGKQTLFFSAAGYTDQAIQYASKVGMSCYVYDPLGALELVNGIEPMKPVRTHYSPEYAALGRFLKWVYYLFHEKSHVARRPRPVRYR